MYQSHFQLTSRPFASAPHPEHYFPATTIEHARESLVMAIDRAAGAALVMGGVGTGKSLLCQLLVEHFAGRLPVCMLPSTRLCTRQTMIQALLHQLGLPFRNQDEGELRLTLNDHIIGPACPQGILLIVDEADRLPLVLLEELRVISNLTLHGQPRVRLVMAGGPRLEEQVGHPRMESLNQRVVARMYLRNFTAAETSDYIRARITASDGDADSIFTAGALRAVFQATAGVPRLVNQLCEHAMVLAAVGQRTQLDEAGIEEAWSDLQQLPLPLPTSAPASTVPDVTDAVIEFASLEEPTASTEPTPADVESEVESAVPDADQEPSEEPNQYPLAEDEQAASDEGVSEFNIEPDPCDAVPSETFPASDETLADAPDRSTSVSDELDDAADAVDAERDNEFEESVNERQSDDDFEFTIEQAANPFDEEFETEELVIRQFAGVNLVAKREELEVTSAYSRGLAAKLRAVQPGLRMHEDHPAEEVPGGFLKLSDYLNAERHDRTERAGEEDADEQSAVAFPVAASDSTTPSDSTEEEFVGERLLEEARLLKRELENDEYENESSDAGEKTDDPQVVLQFDPARFDPQDDPVMPEPAVAGLTPTTDYFTEESVVVEEIQPEVYSQVQEVVHFHGAVDAPPSRTPPSQTPARVAPMRAVGELDSAASPAVEAADPAPSPPRPPKTKSFRSLFSSIKRA